MVRNLIRFEPGPAKLHAGGETLILRNHSLQGVAVIGPTQQGFGMDGELASLATYQRCGDAGLGAKLIGLMDLTLADAFHLRHVQGRGLGQGPASIFPEYLYEACFFVSFYPSNIK